MELSIPFISRGSGVNIAVMYGSDVSGFMITSAFTYLQAIINAKMSVIPIIDLNSIQYVGDTTDCSWMFGVKERKSVR